MQVFNNVIPNKGNLSGLNINIPYAGENVNIDLLTAENVEYILGMDLATFFEKAKNIDYCIFNLISSDEEQGEIRESFLSQYKSLSDYGIVLITSYGNFSFNLSIIKENDTFTTAVLVFQDVEE